MILERPGRDRQAVLAALAAMSAEEFVRQQARREAQPRSARPQPHVAGSAAGVLQGVHTPLPRRRQPEARAAHLQVCVCD